MITARFETRENAELAVEHLVQQFGLPRDRVSVRPAGETNTSGTRAAGADTKEAPEPEGHVATNGALLVSVDSQTGDAHKIEKALMDVGASDVQTA